ncbi:MAG TPA: hypothetical protein PLJ50_05515 [Candidatus Latescibacteria bacterium]|nr:hypothetical protein [Candidatus Latescibacterota bacterium]
MKTVVQRARAGAPRDFRNNRAHPERNRTRTRRSEWPPIGAFRGKGAIPNGVKNLFIRVYTFGQPYGAFAFSTGKARRYAEITT